MVSLLPILLTLGAPGAAAPAPATALERNACEQQFRMLAKAMGSEERPSAKDLDACVDAQRKVSAGYGLKQDQYESWLRCKAGAKSAVGSECDKMLWEQAARKAGDEIDAMFEEDKRRETAALAALAPYRDKGRIAAGTFKQIESASRDGKHASLSDLFEDAVHVLEAGRVRPGTELAIYPHEAISLQREPPPQKGERAADLAFVDARSGKRVVRFARLGYVALLYRVGNGEVANALAWVAEKRDARSIEVPVEMDSKAPAHLLLESGAMEEVAKLGKRMPRGMERVPLLSQGQTSISFERWLALAAVYRKRGLDRDDADVKVLSRMVTLADLEKVLR